MRKILLTGQGFYFALTGLWPLLHLPSFLAVTGPKKEAWLVVTVGLLILMIGATLLTAALQRQRERSPELLGFFSTLAMGAVDVRYATREVILDIYLLDAVAEFLLALCWLWVFFKTDNSKGKENT